MSDEGRSPTSTFRLLAEQERRREGSGHPSPETLTAYREDRLGATEVEQIRGHLALCAHCTQLVLDFSIFQDAMSAQADSGGASLGTAPPDAWQRLRSRLAADLPAAFEQGPTIAPPDPPGVDELARRLVRYRRSVLTLAAALAACIIGFPLWVAGHRSPTSEPLAAAMPNAGIIERGAGATLTVRLGSGVTALLLPIPSERSFGAYRIDVFAPGGVLRLTAAAEPTRVTVVSPPVPPSAPSPGRPRSLGPLMLPLAGGQLPSGEYEVQVLGISGNHPERIAGYGLRVLPP
jgi:hypothetical protein